MTTQESFQTRGIAGQKTGPPKTLLAEVIFNMILILESKIKIRFKAISLY